MDNKNDFMRIEGHPEPLEIQEHYGSPKGAAGVKTDKTKKAKPAKTDRVASSIGAFVAAICVLALVGIVYWLSGVRKGATEPSAPSTAYNAEEIIAIDGTGAGIGAISATDAAVGAMDDAAVADEADAVYLFPTDGSAIPENAELTAVAEQAKKNGSYVTVTAYTDETGRAAYNQQLSEKRAKSVGKYLADHGVAPDHITTRGMGPTHAYATNALDRRAEVRLN